MIRVVPEAMFEGECKAEVQILDKVFDAASATFGVWLRLASPDYRLPADIKCLAEIAT